MEQNQETLGKRIMRLRKARGWTQEQLAEKLGISAQAISKWENDISCPDISLLPALAALFGVRVDTLLGIPEEAPEEPKETFSQETAETPPLQQTPAKAPARDWGSIAWACILIGLGLLFLLNKWLGFHSGDLWGMVWPAVLLGLGLSWFLRSWSILSLGLAILGLLFLLQNLGSLSFSLDWNTLWPLLLILCGLDCLLSSLGLRRRSAGHAAGAAGKAKGPWDYVPENGRIDVNAIFCSDARRVRGNLQGGSVGILFAGGTLDLTSVQALGEKGAAILEFQVVFGGYDLILPPNIRVDNQLHCTFGGTETKGSSRAEDATLTLRGNVIFGGVDIRYVG